MASTTSTPASTASTPSTSATPPTPDMPNVYLSQSSAPTFYKPAVARIDILGTNVNTIVDSGSSISVISAAFLQRLGPQAPRLHPAPLGFRPTAANNEPLTVTGKVNLSFNIGSKDFTHEFVVADQFPYPALIGNDVLQPYRANIDYASMTVTLDNCNPVKFTVSAPTLGQVYLIRATENNKLLSQSRTVFSVATPDVPDGFDFLFSPAQSKRNHHEPQPTAAHALVRTSDGRIPVEMINPHSQNRRVLKNQIIGTLEFVGEEQSTFSIFSLDDPTSTAPLTASTPPPARPPTTPSSASPLSQSTPPRVHSPGSTARPTPAVLPEAVAARINPNLEPHQARQFHEMIADYLPVFATDNKRPNVTNRAVHRIDTGDHRPVRQSLRHHGPAGEAFIESEVETYLKKGIIRPSTSEWISNVVLVKKKDNTLRFAIDYRGLNRVTRKMSAPIPHLRTAVDVLSGASYFTSLDCASGYWSIPMHPEDIHKTAFTTRSGNFEFTVLPYGLTGAVATFQNAMNSLLSGLTWKISLVYLDDILIFSRTFDEHLAHVRLVLDRFKDAGFQLNLGKCTFAAPKTRYLGFVISRNGSRPDPSNVDKINNASTPKNAAEAYSFAMLCQYYAHNVPRFSEIAEPLLALHRKDTPFVWTNREQNAFDTLKRLITTAPNLAFPDFTRSFILDTDASNKAISAVLSQLDDQQKEHPIAFWSRLLTDSERKTNVTEREALAIVKGCDRFKHYLEWKRFLLRTDHAALQTLPTMKDPHGRLSRWILKMQAYDYTPLHRAGKSHANADSHTRPPLIDSAATAPAFGQDGTGNRVDDEVQFADDPQLVAFILPPLRLSYETFSSSSQRKLLQPDLLTVSASTDAGIVNDNALAPYKHSVYQMIRHQQPTDPFCSRVIQSLKLSNQPFLNGYTLRNGLLYRFPNNAVQPHRISNLQLAVPRGLRFIVCQQLHDSHVANHAQAHRFLYLVKSHYYWPSYENYCLEFVKTCPECQLFRKRLHRKAGLMLPQVPPFHPFTNVIIDFLGPFPKSRSGNTAILSMICLSTRFKIYAATPDMTAKSAANAIFNKLILRFGAFEVLQSDRAQAFLGEIVRLLLEILDANKITSSGFHPQTQGPLERTHRDVTPQLAILARDQPDTWDEFLDSVSLFENSVPSRSTRHSPFFLAHGFDPRLPIDTALALPRSTAQLDAKSYVEQLVLRLQVAREFALKNTLSTQAQNKSYYDQDRLDRVFHVGDLVTLPNMKRQNKLAPASIGPFRIISRSVNGVTYTLRHFSKRNSKPVVAHVDRLEHFRQRTPFLLAGNDIIGPSNAASSTPTDASPSISSQLAPGEIALAPQQPHVPQLPTATGSQPPFESVQPPQVLPQPLPPQDVPQPAPVDLPPRRIADRLSRLDNLKETLAEMLQVLKARPNFDLPAMKRALRTLLGEGSFFISNSTRNRDFMRLVGSLKTRDALLLFVTTAHDDFSTVFDYEIRRAEA